MKKIRGIIKNPMNLNKSNLNNIELMIEDKLFKNIPLSTINTLGLILAEENSSLSDISLENDEY